MGWEMYNSFEKIRVNQVKDMNAYFFLTFHMVIKSESLFLNSKVQFVTF